MTERDRTVLGEKDEKEDFETRLRQAEVDESVNEQSVSFPVSSPELLSILCVFFASEGMCNEDNDTSL